MLKILLCCGGGFSSSYINQRMQKEIEEKGLSEKVSFEYSPFSLALEKAADFDIIVCCPHLNIYVKQVAAKQEVPIPMYLLPPRMYGKMEIEEIYQDAQDIVAIFNETKTNPVHFPGEDNVLRIRRMGSYASQK